jgi:hypothetical protein
MANPTIIYFGSALTTILMQHSADFTGVAPAGLPTITPGLYTFAAQACGKYAFHDSPVLVKGISYKGGGTLTVTKHLKSDDSQIGTLPAITADFSGSIFVGSGEYLKFVTSGATAPKLAVTAHEVAMGAM